MRNFLLFLVLALVLIRLLRPRRARPTVARPVGTQPTGVRELVQDPVCHAFVDRTAALTTVDDGQVHYFCSSACYRRFLGEGSATGTA